MHLLRNTFYLAGLCVCVYSSAAQVSAVMPADLQTVPSAQPGAAVQAPADYVIGPDDVLGVLFWRDETLSGDVVVRPDGKISLPLLNEIEVAGMTPEQLRGVLLTRASKFVEEPSVAVVVRAINSRKVFITGQVSRPGSYPLTAPTSVLQLIAVAGGLTDYADSKNVVILRKEQGRPISLKFNYQDVRKGKKLEQNILLQVGDTIVVP